MSAMPNILTITKHRKSHRLYAGLETIEGISRRAPVKAALLLCAVKKSGKIYHVLRSKAKPVKPRRRPARRSDGKELDRRRYYYVVKA